MTRKPKVATLSFLIITEPKLRQSEFQEKQAIEEESILSIDFTMPTTPIFAKCATETRPPTLSNAGYGLTRRTVSTILTSITNGWIDYSQNHVLVKLFSHALVSSEIGHRNALDKIKEDIVRLKKRSYIPPL